MLESCMKHCLCLFFYMASRHFCGKRRRDVEVVQIDNLKGLQGIRRMDRVPNAWIRELCGVRKGLDERIDEGVLRWFRHMERMERDRIAKRVCGRVCR